MLLVNTNSASSLGVQVDDPLGVVDHISRTLQFRHYHCASGELGQVDGPVRQSSVLHRPPGAVYCFKTETGVGDHFREVAAVHLCEMDSRFQVVKENQRFNAVPGLQLHLLGRGDGDMGVIALLLRYPVSARLTVGEQDFSRTVRLIIAQVLAVLPDTERNAA